MTGWRAGGTPAHNAQAVTPLGGAAYAPLAGGMTARMPGAAFAYHCKGHDRPAGAGVALASWGGWSGIPPPGDEGGTEKMQGA